MRIHLKPTEVIQEGDSYFDPTSKKWVTSRNAVGRTPADYPYLIFSREQKEPDLEALPDLT